MVTDQAAVARAKAKPDIHCPYCNARNVADAKVCVQCGGDLTGATPRQAGQTVGAFDTAPKPDAKCATCGTMNPATARVCKSCGAPLPVAAPAPKPVVQPVPAKGGSSIGCMAVAIGAVVLGLLAVAGFFWWGTSQTKTVDAVAVSPHWSTTITVQGLVPVEYAAWSDEVPNDAEVMSCRDEVRDVVDQPVPNSREVCGTPYIVDQGTGYGEVQQDCRYEVIDNLCQYRVLEWRVVDTLMREGESMSLLWPNLALDQETREAGRSATYSCILRADDQELSIPVASLEALATCQPGSRWQVVLDGFGGIDSAQPQP
jgi:hypothetical protein